MKDNYFGSDVYLFGWDIELATGWSTNESEEYARKALKAGVTKLNVHRASDGTVTLSYAK